MSIIYFLILIGVLVFVHEFGHFIVAKAFDVKVLRFSIGFGPALLSYTRGETEYVVCALPLGGYVQMLGADLESIETLEPEDQARALMQKPIWQRSLIVLAGPAFNLFLPVLIYLLVGMTYTTAPPSIVGEVFPDTPAQQAGLQPGDEIVAINGKPVRYWHELTHVARKSYEQTLHIEYARDGQRFSTEAVPEKYTSTDFLGLHQRTYGALGLHLGTSGTTIALSGSDTPASEAGLQFSDRILAVNNEPVQRFDELKSKIQRSNGASLDLLVLRRTALNVDFGAFYAQHTVTVSVTPVMEGEHYTLGIRPIEMHLIDVNLESPAAKAGLLPGDRIVSANGQPYINWSLFSQYIHNTINEQILDSYNKGIDIDELQPEFTLIYERQGREYSTILLPEIIGFQDDTKQQRYRVEIGWEHMRDSVLPEDIAFPFFPRLLHSTAEGVSKTSEFVKMMFVGLVRLAQGRVSTESIGGPIMIGELAAEAGRAGIEPFLQMMALISINLAIINLLPIPVLDGGHLLLFALEAIKRGPLSFRTRQIAAYIGFTFIVFLMIFAFKNDIERNWHRVVEYFESHDG